MNGDINKIDFQIETVSNLFIGGVPGSFEIGGIDQFTVTDQYEFPIIPASSIKGTIATIIREDNSQLSAEITQLYREYLLRIRQENRAVIRELVKEKEAIDRIVKRYEDALSKKNMSEYLFGITGFNNTPKLLFSDLLLEKNSRNKDTCFSIDMKNSISTGGGKPTSNPRSYKTARAGLIFEGSIKLHKIMDLGKGADQLCEEFLHLNLKKFNEGIYRLGNSKSRGYGKVKVHFLNKGEEHDV